MVDAIFNPKTVVTPEEEDRRLRQEEIAYRRHLSDLREKEMASRRHFLDKVRDKALTGAKKKGSKCFVIHDWATYEAVESKSYGSKKDRIYLREYRKCLNCGCEQSVMRGRRSPMYFDSDEGTIAKKIKESEQWKEK